MKKILEILRQYLEHAPQHVLEKMSDEILNSINENEIALKVLDEYEEKRRTEEWIRYGGYSFRKWLNYWLSIKEDTCQS